MQNFQNPQQDNANQSVSVAQNNQSAEGSGASLVPPAYQLQQTNQAAGNPVLGTAQDRAMSVQYELIAHGFAYSSQLSGPQQTLATAMGFQNQWARTTNFDVNTGAYQDENANTGFFAGVLFPSTTPIMSGAMDGAQGGAGAGFNDQEFSLEGPSEETDVNPVMAFRGSEVGDQFKLDWFNNDMDPIAVGYTAFMLNYQKINDLLAEAVSVTGKRVVVTGHSLGGSLAKQAALHFPQFISACYTYQAPGIAEAQQAYLEANMNQQGNVNGDQMSDTDRVALDGFSDVDTHGFDDILFESHTAEGDVVNYAGGGRIPGSRRIKHDPSGVTGLTPLAHMAMVTSSSEYQQEHNALHQEMLRLDPSYSSTTEELYSSSKGARSGTEPMGIDNPARNTTDNVHQTIEGARDAIIAEMFNPHAELINNFPGRIAQIPLASRVTILRSLLNGPGIIESLTKGAGVGMGITALLAAPGTVLGMAGGALAGFSEYGGDSTAGTVASTAAGAGMGLGAGMAADSIMSMIPILSQAKGALAVAAPVAGVLGGLSYAYFAISNDINQTQEAALKMILFSPPGEQKEMIQQVGGATIFYQKMDTLVNDFFGSDVFERTRNAMIQNGGYFAQLNAAEGSEEIRNNLDGGFLGMGDNTQEKLIADVLVYGIAGNEILAELGGGDYDEGLEIVLKKLQGREDDMVSNKFNFTDGRSRWFW